MEYNWISIEKVLPEFDKDVLICTISCEVHEAHRKEMDEEEKRDEDDRHWKSDMEYNWISIGKNLLD